MLRERQLTKHGGSKMHLIGAEPPYQLWYPCRSPHPHPLPDTLHVALFMRREALGVVRLVLVHDPQV